MKSLHDIDEALSFKVNLISQLGSAMDFSPVCEFDLSPDGLSHIPWPDLKYPGVYFIEIQNCRRYNDFASWAEAFQVKWLDEKYRHKFVANPKKARIAKHSQLPEWIPLYIGKSKDISKRVHEHIHLALEKPTFALKLACREHLQGERFRLSAIKVKVENYDWIMPVLEKTLRDKLNPIIGRQ
jgi:hypothetical protein